MKPDASASRAEYLALSNGEVALAVHDGASIHLKSVTKYGDPVELSAEEARELAAHLLRLADMIE